MLFKIWRAANNQIILFRVPCHQSTDNQMTVRQSTLSHLKSQGYRKIQKQAKVQLRTLIKKKRNLIVVLLICRIKLTFKLRPLLVEPH